MTLFISSPVFEHNGAIPVRHTCDGQNVSPQLLWTGVPDAATSMVLIVDDPDAPDPAAPKMTWVHWVLYNIPSNANGLEENTTERNLLPGTLQGKNSWQHIGYEGPCPPIGSHRYFHKLYALNVVLPDLHFPTKTAVEKAMAGHIIADAELIGRYGRS